MRYDPNKNKLYNMWWQALNAQPQHIVQRHLKYLRSHNDEFDHYFGQVVLSKVGDLSN